MCIDKLTNEFILNCFENSWMYSVSTFFESNFVTSLIGAAAGALAGAVGAHLISKSQKNKDLLIEELRNTNSAIIVCADVMEICINLKINHIKPMVMKYKSHKCDLDKHLEESKDNPSLVLDINAILNIINFPSIELSIFRKLIFEKISLDGKTLSIAFKLLRTLNLLELFMDKRNNIINTNDKKSKEAILSWYFGIQDKNGHTNNHFRDHVYGMEKYVDDSIILVRFLIGELEKHSKILSRRYGKNSPVTPRINLARYINDMPSYQSNLLK